MRRGGNSPDPARDETGSVIMMVAFCMAILVGFVITAMVVGRLSSARREVQNAADAVALAGAFSLQQRGIDFDPNWAASFGRMNASLLGPLAHQATASNVGVRTLDPRPEDEARAIVRSDVRITWDSGQSWFSGLQMFDIRASSFAQVNERVYAAVWPIVVFMLDASTSMDKPLLGGCDSQCGCSAWDVLTCVLTRYTEQHTFPVRNGVIIFHQNVIEAVPPPTANLHHFGEIAAAFARAGPKRIVTTNEGQIVDAQTNTAEALQRARSILGQAGYGGRDDQRSVVLISDGAPTRGGGNCADGQCHIAVARTQARQLRFTHEALGGTWLFTIEIRRQDYDGFMSQFMIAISGEGNSGGGNQQFRRFAQTGWGVDAWIDWFAQSVCQFALDPQPPAPADQYRLRRGLDDLVQPRERVFAFLRRADGSETQLTRVDNATMHKWDRAFQYRQVGGEWKVVLTLQACNDLGSDPENRLVVRWDQPQLTCNPEETRFCNPQ